MRASTCVRRDPLALSQLMHVDLRRFGSWCVDLAVAYAGGLVLGSPFALVSVRLTGIDLAATLCMVVAMAALFVTLRRTAQERRVAGTSSIARGAINDAASAGCRRVA